MSARKASPKEVDEAEIINLTIYDTKASHKKLRRLVESLYTPASGWSGGIDVREEEKIPGAYIIEEYRGEITDNSGRVRIVGNQVWSGKFAWMVGELLRGNRVSYTSGSVSTSVGEACAKRARRYNVSKLEDGCTVNFH